MNHIQIAKVCHEVTRAYAIAMGEPAKNNPAWNEAHYDITDKIIADVKTYLTFPAPPGIEQPVKVVLVRALVAELAPFVSGGTD